MKKAVDRSGIIIYNNSCVTDKGLKLSDGVWLSYMQV